MNLALRRTSGLGSRVRESVVGLGSQDLGKSGGIQSLLYGRPKRLPNFPPSAVPQ